jgi:WD40 repeat protein
VATGKLVRIFEGHSGAVSSIAFSPDGRTVLSGSARTADGPLSKATPPPENPPLKKCVARCRPAEPMAVFDKQRRCDQPLVVRLVDVA